MKRTVRLGFTTSVVTALVLSLAACGTAENDAPEDAAGDEPVTLRMTWWGGETRHERTQEAIDLFEDAHPNITVEAEFADFSGYWERLATTTAGGNTPDVIQMDELYLASYAGRGVLAPLDEYDIDTSALDPAILGMGVFDEELYAIPISTSATAFLVNPAVIESAGVPLPDTSTWTWDEFGQWAQAISDATPEATYGTSILNALVSLQLVARQQGDSLFSDGGIAIKPETLANYFQLALDWTKNGAAPPASVTAETAKLPLEQQPFTAGEAAAWSNSATLISAYQNAMGEGTELEIVPFPTFEDTDGKWDYFKAGMYWSMSAGSEHPAEAALLIDFLVNDPQVAEIIGTERGLPASDKALAAIADSLTPGEQKAVEYSQSRMRELGEAPAIAPNGAANVSDVLWRYTQEVIFENLTPMEAAEAMIAEVQASIDAAG